MISTKTWPYGTQRKGVVRLAYWRPRALDRRASAGQLIEDELGEMHLCVGPECGDPGARDGDAGTLTFTQGGPTGGYWKFRRAVA